MKMENRNACVCKLGMLIQNAKFRQNPLRVADIIHTFDLENRNNPQSLQKRGQKSF